MKAEYINAFIKATQEVFKTMVRVEVTTGKPYIKSSPYIADSLIIVLGITGEIKGQAAINMNEDLAKTLAMTMMMGMSVEELDELSKSALSELANMIMGNAATLLFNLGLSVDITPPTLILGNNVEISSATMTTICVPLSCELGDFTLDLSIKE